MLWPPVVVLEVEKGADEVVKGRISEMAVASALVVALAVVVAIPEPA